MSVSVEYAVIKNIRDQYLIAFQSRKGLVNEDDDAVISLSSGKPSINIGNISITDLPLELLESLANSTQVDIYEMSESRILRGWRV